MEILNIKLGYAERVITRLLEEKYQEVMREIEREIGRFKAFKIDNYGYNHFHMMVCSDEGKFVIKVVQDEDFMNSRWRFENNVRMLKYLENFDFIPSPKFICSGRNYLVYEYIEGDVYGDENSEGVRQRVIEEVKEIIKKMRNITSDDGLFVDPFRAKDITHMKLHPEKIQDEYPWNITKDGEVRFVLSHNDLHEHNIIVKDGKLAGIIDWELSGFYHQLYEASLYNSEHTSDNSIKKEFISILRDA